MHSWQYEPGDILIIKHKGVEQVARVAGYDDSLDNTTPLYVNLRVSGGLRWGERMVKVRPEQIRGEDREWYARQKAAFDASITAAADAAYAKMTPVEKQRLHEQMERRRRRSPLDVMIDRACGLE
jgi:hypothetical protein